MLLLDPATYTLLYRVEDLAQSFWANWQGRYPLITKSTTSQTGYIPICLGNQSNIVAAGDENGNVYVWRDAESIKENIGVNLTGHSSSLQRICLSTDDKRMLTLGANDQSLFQWKVNPVEQKPQIDNIFQVRKPAPKDKKIVLTDESLINEMNFCFYAEPPAPTAGSDPVQPTDDSSGTPSDNGLLIRGCNHQAINRLGARLNFDPSGEEEWKRPPTCMLMLEHIYGVQTSDRRNTILYVHFTGDKSQQNFPTKSGQGGQAMNSQRVEQAINKVLGASYQRNAAEKPIKYDQVHASCHKHFVYFTSRFAIVYSPFQKVQKFYQGHSLKISCIQKHPTRRLLATGDVSLHPTIHIWDAQTLEPVQILETSHKGGILHIAFSPDGQKLVSVGMDRTFSIQIFQWEQNRTLSFRNLGHYPVFSLQFFPFENSKFITCGYEHMAVWQLNGNHLQCQSFQSFESQKPNTLNKQERTRSVIMCMDFLNYRVGNSINSDVLFGTSQGEITTFVSGKHFLLNENAHKGAVNCLIVSDRTNDILTVITGGEDGLVKIWTTTIVLLQVLNIREQVPDILKDMSNPRSYGVQSIELYCCDKQQPRRILIGLRCGEIIEAIMTDQDNAHNITNMSLNQSRVPTAGMLDFQFYSFVSAHSSLNMSQNQKKIQCVVNPDHPVLVSVGDDETLRIWDLEKHLMIYSKHLGTQATALAYSPDGAYLAVGLVSGVVLVLDAKLDRLKDQEGNDLEDFQKPTLEVFMSPKEAKSSVVCIKYSYNGDYLAVSYNNEYRESDLDPKRNQDAAAQVGQSEQSFIMIFVNRISPKNPGLKLGSRDTYVKLMKLVLPLADFQSSPSLRGCLAVTAMDFSDCDGYLEMCVQKINHECVLDPATYKASEDCFVIWDIRNNSMVQNFEALGNSKWPEWSMASAINARFQGSDINVEDGIKERDLLFKELCFMSRVSRFSLLDAAICGSQQGGLYLFRFQGLTIEKANVADFRFDFVRKREMSATRCFSGHTSMIQCIENFQDKLIMTTSVTDQCIVQWKIEYEDKHWELDFNQYQQGEEDPFAEFLTQEKFEKLLSEVWSQRQQVADLNQGVYKKEYLDPTCRFELQNVVGRRAYDRRQNVVIDYNDRIAYQAGSLQVFLSENTELRIQQNRSTPAIQGSQIKQFFLRPDGANFKSVSPELSCFCYSKDLRILFCATAAANASVYVWDTTTNNKLGEFIVPGVPVITNVKVSDDNRKVLVVGLTKEFYQMITMVDWTLNNKVYFTRQFLHSLPYRIRDIEFFNNSTRNFITAGIQHLCFWRLSGSNLEYQVGELTIRKVLTNIGHGVNTHNPANNGRFGLSLVTNEYQQQQFLRPNAKGNENMDDDYENLFVTFLNIIFVGETLITSGDDGFLYLWARERLEHRTYAHEGSIFALHASSNQGLVVSGGMEGIVTLWRLNTDQKSNQKSLQRIKTYNLRQKQMDSQTAVMSPECNVQSVCLGMNRIIVGMRSGSIYEVPLQEDGRGLKPFRQSTVDETTLQTSSVKQWLKCSDHEIPKSVAMDMISSRIFTITLFGLFQVWDLLTFDVIFSKNYAKKTRFLQSFRLSNNVMLVFEHEILVLDSDPKSNNFDEKADYSLNVNLITYATLNQNEQILGVATISTAKQPEVTLYSTEGGFMKLKQIFGFKAAIKYLDFSTDNFYMQVEDQVGEVTLYEIETDRPIQTDAIDFELEWLGEGLRTYARIKGVRHQYNSNNKITKIKKILGKPIVVVADEIGTIRLFNYPNVKGEPFYQCYGDHLFGLSDCVFSPDRLFFVTCCEMDRCIFKWKMHFNEPKINRMLNEDHRKINEASQADKLQKENTMKKPTNQTTSK